MQKEAKCSPANLRRIDRRLREWGNWLVKSMDNGLGYSSKSSSDCINSGGRTTAPFYPRSNPYAEKIHETINGLRAIYPKLYRVIYINYILPGSRNSKLKDNDIAETTFRERLLKAKIWIEKNLKE